MDEESMIEEKLSQSVQHKSQFRTFLLGAAILLCGIIIGITSTFFFHQYPPGRGMRPFDGRGGRAMSPADIAGNIASEMQKKYGLTDDQKSRLCTVFQEHGKRLDAIRTEVQPRVEAEYGDLRKSVEAVLTPEQAAKWRQTEYEEMHKRWRPRGGMFPPGPPPGGGPGPGMPGTYGKHGDHTRSNHHNGGPTADTTTLEGPSDMPPPPPDEPVSEGPTTDGAAATTPTPGDQSTAEPAAPQK